MAEEQGVVVHLDLAKGTGFVAALDGRRSYFSVRQIGSQIYAQLAVGRRVCFEAVDTPRGRRAFTVAVDDGEARIEK